MNTTPKIWYEFRDAVYMKDFSTAERLLHETPTLLQLKNSIGETVLHFLAVENDLEGVAWLKSKGFELNTKNCFDEPVIFEVAQLGYKELFLWFIENGTDIHIQDGDGQDIFNYLLDHGSSEGIALVIPHIIKNLSLDVNIGRFWDLIHVSHLLKDISQAAQLRLMLEQLSIFDLVGFHQRYLYFVEAAYTKELYGAGSLMNGRPLSDDGFEYFRNWLVAQGRIVYETGLIETDALAKLPKITLLEAWDEEMVYVASEIFQAKTGNDIYEQPLQFQYKLSQAEFEWSDYCSPETLKTLYPSLWEVYGDRYKVD
ncbi:MAG: DUF4240 domain-containing protein [Candidatus Competibacter sp.]